MLTASPGWINTTASIAWLGEIARNANSTVEEAQQSVMDALGGIPYAHITMRKLFALPYKLPSYIFTSFNIIHMWPVENNAYDYEATRDRLIT